MLRRLLALGFSFALGCSSTDSAAPREDASAAVVQTYATVVHATYVDAERTAIALRDAIDAFVAAPSDATLAAAKQAWIAARTPYARSEVFRFYGGPIDADETGPEGFLNAWPLDEAYIDYVEGAPDAGIVNSVEAFPTIDEALLLSLNEKDGEKNIATGYHAIEFLLWGQDRDAHGPGKRPASDYVDGVGKNAKRRAQYLKAAASLLVKHLGQVRAAWAPGTAYAAELTKTTSKEALRRIITGMSALTGEELAAERMQVPWENEDQEDEHDCFSDTTLSDLKNGADGVENVWRGRYGTVSGTGLDALVRATDAALAGEMDARIAATRAALDAIPEPFDQAIVGALDAPGRKAVKAAIDAFRSEAQTVGKISQALLVAMHSGS